MSVPSLKEIFRGPLTRTECLLYRLPLVTVLGAAAVVGVGAAGKTGIDHLTTDYGCATAPVAPGSDVLTAAEDAARELDAPQDAAMINTVRKNATVVPGGNDVQPGQPVTVCVDKNPVYGFGDSGWVANVSLPIAAPGE